MQRFLRASVVCAALAMVMVIGRPAWSGMTTLHAGGVLTCGGLPVTIVGTEGDDVIDGTDGPDVIAGLGGNDIIHGGAFDDVICGGPGNDLLEGQGGEDILFGEQGDDVLDGGEGGCCAYATNTGDDVLSGGPGDDELHTSDFPQAGSSVYGDQGNDTIYAWTAAFVYGGNGNDTIYQFTGDAVLDGGNGDDVIANWDDGGLQNETVTIIGGRGEDTLTSEDATGTTDINGGQGADFCTGGTTSTDC